MRAIWVALAVLALGARAIAQDPVVQAEFSNPGLNPSHWVLTLHPDASGHFRSERGKLPADGSEEINVPNVDRDIHVSEAFARRVFDAAQRHSWFNEACESHMKVAFQGWMKLSYMGPEGKGSCTYNYSKDKEIEELGDTMTAVVVTILEGVRLEMLLQHDPLGLDKETAFLTQAAQSGQAQQICVIRGILERLAQDDGVMDLVRKRAVKLLALGET